jgi:hypothetical protein
MYLIHSARCDDPAALQRQPELWRRVRRFNLPVQLAVTAGEEVAGAAEDPAGAALISLAPAHSGSPELFDAVRSLDIVSPHVNPVITLHAVDNLALSALAITLGNQAYGLGLGGGAGQGWVALEVAWERLAEGRESEAVVMAGDQQGDKGLAVALLFARHPAPYPPLGKTLRLVTVNREPGTEGESEIEPHAAAGLDALLTALADVTTTGRWIYQVPGGHGDGRDRPELIWEVA